MQLTKKKFKDLTEVLSLTNGEVELLISLEFGPRILGYGYCGEQNLFQVFDDDIRSITEPSASNHKTEWKVFGGHRLWMAPENPELTYVVDSFPVEYNWDGEKLTVKPPLETITQIQKTIEITLAPTGTKVAINHRVMNCRDREITMAAWGVSVMAEGGRAIIPQEKFTPHTEQVTPTRPLVLWSYTKMNDPRFIWGEKYIQMIQDNQFKDPIKIGVLHRRATAAYLLNNQLFIKQHSHKEGTNYPDMGCNAEFFTMPHFLEVESLSPLMTIAPHCEIDHLETWQLKKVPSSFLSGDLTQQEKKFSTIFKTSL